VRVGSNRILPDSGKEGQALKSVKYGPKDDLRGEDGVSEDEGFGESILF